MSRVISPRTIASGLDELWSPRVVGEFDDSYVKVAKIQGEFVWHAHDNEDELFYVLAGQLQIDLHQPDADSVTLNAGEMFVVPKGVQHRPVAREECLILLVERKSTAHTGNVEAGLAKSIADQLRPLS